MKILIPREAWPSAIAASLSSGSAGVNSIAPSAFSGTATTAARAANPVAVAGLDLDAVAALRDRRHRSRRAGARTAPPTAIASSSARVPPTIVTRPPVNWVSSRL